MDSVLGHCNLCGRETWHEMWAERVITGTAEIESGLILEWADTHQMIECKGCQSVRLKVSSAWDGGDVDRVSYYPPAMSRRLPPWKEKLPEAVKELLEETYAALQSDSRRLVLMGARTLLDMMMLEKVGDAGSFRDKLDALEKAGVVGAISRSILEAALDAGSAAAHRGYKPTPEQLNAVVDIVENALQTSFHLETLAIELRKSTPPRKP